MPVGPVPETETLTRFTYEDSYFRADNTVKPKAFYPDQAGTCSVMATTGLDHSGTCAVAAQYVTPHRRRALLGYANVSCSVVFRVGLRADFDEPPPNHANICGHSRTREEVMERAHLLAKEASFTRV